MQWLMNEFKAFREDVQKRIDAFLDSPVVKDNDERIKKIEGEIKAMKARMGKYKAE